MSTEKYVGVLFIGDPHLEGRQPGFRKDDYPNVILDKLAWSLDYARVHRLLPVLLGDLFDKPRDNPTWVIGRLFEIMQGEILSIYGNHDVHYQPELTEHDSLSLLVKAGCLRILSTTDFWSGSMNGRKVIIGGSSYRQEIPEKFTTPAETAEHTTTVFDQNDPNTVAERFQEERPLTIWVTHHDIQIPGYDEGRVVPQEIEGIDVLINGHIHRRLETVRKGKTEWVTPGNISRRSRSDATKDHVPSVLRIDVRESSWDISYVTVPHEPFDEVFYDAVIQTAEKVGSSAFVAGLAELQTRRTSTGAGLKEFLKQNVDRFEPRVIAEIWKLAEEVTDE